MIGIEPQELPPRARRIHITPPVNHDILGTTSACAENTDPVAISLLTWGNYLRVRGEYTGETYTDVGLSELPPRARRIHHFRMCHGLTGGTTSACAENTLHSSTPANHKRNYLRVRGEYLPSESNACTPMELPPRARRIRFGCGYHPAPLGTTSACAENTPHYLVYLGRSRNYLRVRGEYGTSSHFGCSSGELPPRARRILVDAKGKGFAPGTTSACAENTVFGRYRVRRRGNYLRVRGEYRRSKSCCPRLGELPPRARRILAQETPHVLWGGTTSACAENTGMTFFPTRPPGNYLRVRGEYWGLWSMGSWVWELPPRARRIPLPTSTTASKPGTTSACAENTPAQYH